MKITRSELVGLFLQQKGAKLCTLIYSSDARVRKTSNPHPLVTKTVRVNCVANYNYSRALQKRLANLGQNPIAGKEVHDRTWGVRVGQTPIIEHKGKTYIDVMVGKVLDIKYKDTESGKELTYEDVKDFLPNKDPSTVKVANISTDNIMSVKMGGVEYEIS